MNVIHTIAARHLSALALALTLVAAALPACSDGGGSSPPVATGVIEAGAVVVLAPPAGEDPALDRFLADRVVPTDAPGFLATLTGVAPEVVRVPGPLDAAARAALAEEHGAGLVLVVDAQRLAPDVVPASVLAGAPQDAYVLRAVDEGTHRNHLGDGSLGATFVYTAGDGPLPRQYAVYEALRRLGARFYHPEDTFLPRLPPAQIRARAKAATAISARDPETGLFTPDFAHRSYTFHGAHPLEHLESFGDAAFPIDEAERVNDWIIANRGDLFRGAGRSAASAASRAQRAAELAAFRALTGQRGGAGITLHNQQQGASGTIDPTSPVPVKEQIETQVRDALANAPDAYSFGVHFGPTEFTTTPDEDTVQWIDWAGQAALAARPDVVVEVNDHISGSQPVAHYDDLGCPPGTNDDGVADYYDLAFHTDPRFAAKVHTVMFYPLEGPARVYNQVSFAHKLCLMEEASAAGRPLVWFPEGSWWLSFDNTVPVWLPLYMAARRRDIELLTPLLASRGGGTLYDHRMFDSGHEWGYWQQDYAVGLWHWDVDVSLDQVVAELVEPFCPVAAWPDGCAAGREAAAVLDAAMADQVDTFLTAVDWEGRAGGLYAYFAGEDPGDEIAAVTGFEFRPVKVAFQRVLRWSDAQAQHFAETDLDALAAFAERWDALLARLDAVRADVPDEGVRWFEELRDGVAIDALRAHQTHGLYAAILAFRAAPKDDPAVTTPLAEAASALAGAEEVIRRREAMYRYPAAQEYGGGLTPETAVDNGTTYPYRVHTKTHLMTYWLNRDAEVAAILAGDEDDGPRLEVGPTFADPGVAAQIAWPDLPGLGGSLAMGDGATVTPPTTEHAYAATPAIWAVSGVLTSLGSEIPVAGTLVRTTHRARADGLALAEPDSDVARTVLESLAPPFLVAIDTTGEAPILAFATDGDQDGDAPFDGVTRVPLDEAGETAFTSAPVLLSLPIADPSSGNVAATLRVQAAIFSGPLLEGDFAGDVAIAGDLVIDDLVDALIAIAGFDREGALQTLASVLAFDPTDPPATIPIQASLPVVLGD